MTNEFAVLRIGFGYVNPVYSSSPTHTSIGSCCGSDEMCFGKEEWIDHMRREKQALRRFPTDLPPVRDLCASSFSPLCFPFPRNRFRVLVFSSRPSTVHSPPSTSIGRWSVGGLLVGNGQSNQHVLIPHMSTHAWMRAWTCAVLLPSETSRFCVNRSGTFDFSYWTPRLVATVVGGGEEHYGLERDELYQSKDCQSIIWS